MLSFSDIMNLVWALVGVVLVLFLAYYLTKLYAKKFSTALGNGRQMKVIDRIPVGKGSAIAVIDVAGRQYLVGVCENSITLLSELEEPLPPIRQNDVQQMSFLKTMKSVMLKESGEEHNDKNQK